MTKLANEGNLIKYSEVYDGKTHVFYCTKEEWEIKLLIEKIVAMGVDRKLLEELNQLSWGEGYYEAEQDYEEQE